VTKIDETNSLGSGEHLLTLKDVERITSLRKSTIYALIQQHKFPRAISLSARRRAWLSSQVLGWIADRRRASNVL